MKPSYYDTVKRIIDVSASLFFIVLLAPLFFLTALIVSLDGYPFLFQQERIGKFGQKFTMYKFRSMVPDAEAILSAYLQVNEAAMQEWNLNRKLKNDPRNTSIGIWLRRTSIDELPQLWNVLIGDMSLVGPRPILLDEIDLWGPNLDSYQRIRPGITGLWQVSGRSLLSYEKRIELDLIYIEKRSWLLDSVIALKTIKIVIRSIGAS